ncbi:amine sulfotransferase-like [Haemaphysalis longicornis]
MNPDAYRDVDGLWMHSFFHEDMVRSALAYSPQPDDLFIVTYPKCGTTWMQYLILSILSKGHPPKTVTDFMLASPFLEMMGAESAEMMPRPGPIKTHLPFDRQPYSEQAKYIYVTRNPYDVCVSFYYYMRCFTPRRVEDVSFAKFHEMFLSGKLAFGPYFDHLLSWYEHRNDPNVLFFTYEEMKKDPKIWTLKIADFIDKQYGDELRKDDTMLQAVLDASSLKNMQGVFNDHIQPDVKDLLCLPPERRIKSIEVYRERTVQEEELHQYTGFVRKGIVGDWRAHFTPEQIEKTKSWIHEKTRGSDVMALWKDIDLP